MNNFERYVTGFLVCALISMLIYAYVFHHKIVEYKSMKEYNLRHQGTTGLYLPPEWDINTNDKLFNYDIRSWDGGQNWYAVEYKSDTKELKVIGDVDTLYPGLLKKIEGLNDLIKYVEENGTIEGSTYKEIELLKDAGLVTETKK